MEGPRQLRNSERYNGKDWQLWGISMCGRDMVGVLELVEKNKKKPYWVATVNPEFMMATEREKGFKKLLEKTDLNVVDGIGLIWAREVEKRFLILDSRNWIKKLIIGFEVGVQILHGKYRNQVVSGADLMREMALKGGKMFFLGGWDKRAEKTAKYFKELNPQLKVEWSEGRPKIEDEEVIKQINKFEPDYLMVALSMKKQEEWIEKNLNKLKCGVVMGVGRSFDYYSGELPRAPEWMRKMGMEWLFSLLMEPKRWKRQLALPQFIFKVILGI